MRLQINMDWKPGKASRIWRFAILDAVRGNYHFAVEAGVGIGKSFAYLVPLLLYNKKTGLPVIIATSTIALQEQLMDDIKRLKSYAQLSHPMCFWPKAKHTMSVNCGPTIILLPRKASSLLG